MASTLLKILTANRNWWISMFALFTDYTQARIIYRRWRDFVSLKLREEGFSGLRPISAEILSGDLVSFKITCSECGKVLTEEDFRGALIWEAWNELPDFYCNAYKWKASKIILQIPKASYVPGEVVSILGNFNKDTDVQIDVLDSSGAVVSSASTRSDPNGNFKKDLWRIPLDFDEVRRFSVAARSDSKKAETSFYVSKVPLFTEEVIQDINVGRAVRTPNEIVYPPDSAYQFYRDLSGLFSRAESELFVIDTYPNEELVDLIYRK
jgi:hypothetical protein